MATVLSNNLQNLPADAVFRAASRSSCFDHLTVMVQSTYLVGGTWWVAPGEWYLVGSTWVVACGGWNLVAARGGWHLVGGTWWVASGGCSPRLKASLNAWKHLPAHRRLRP